MLLLLLFGMMPLASGPASVDGVCAVGASPEYYAIDLVPTTRIPTARRATGVARVTYAPSPFGIAVAPAGQYVYDLAVEIERLPPAREGVYVAWVASANLDQVRRLGPLDAEHRISGRVDWNKFLVVVTLEPSDDPAGERWKGPVVLRGMSRSGMMHTMAGHGPFQKEPCANFGYF